MEILLNSKLLYSNDRNPIRIPECSGVDIVQEGYSPRGNINEDDTSTNLTSVTYTVTSPVERVSFLRKEY